MIQMPRRSVTRFFIPLIDVMTLLFCIFLLMPIYKQNDPAEPENRLKVVQAKLLKKQEDLDRLKAELEMLKKRQSLPLQERLALRVLEIDPADGKLSYLEPGRPPIRRSINSPESAHELIERQQEELAKRYPDPALRPELHFLFLLPRVDSAYPQGEQLRSYLSWFAKVSHGIDRPTLTK